ncbi:MAG: biopolymer transporter ExbD [Pseudomonadota bacterium]
MRKSSASSSDESAEVNITPLLDIVFILLIFFIVTATFLREEGIDVRTPEDNEDEPDTVPPPALVLSVQEDGFVRVNGVRTIDPGSVKPVVQEFVAREPRGVVLVSAAPDSESGVTVQVMDQAKDGGAGAVSLTLQRQ